MEMLHYVRIQKIAPTESPINPPADPATYAFGQLSQTGHSLPGGYSMEGWLICHPELDERVVLLRRKRNDLICLGVFRSTRVTKIEEGYFWTQNSIYRIEIIDSPAQSELRADDCLPN